MKTQINIAELLEDCPKGMELYSPLCGKCVFDRLNFGTIICKKQNTQEITFTSKGYYMLPVSDDCECMIFPSKDQRDWSKFVPPYKFKDGDIYYIKDVFGLEFVSIIKKCENNKLYTYVDIGISTKSFYCDASEGLCYCKDIIEHRPATEEEKAKLFQEIKDNGCRWSPETKTLEEFVKPKFKVGDKVLWNYNTEITRTITAVEYSAKRGYVYWIVCKGCSSGWWGENELTPIPDKFDITTLIPFESRVLMRSSNAREWVATFYSHYNNNYFFGCGMMCQQCIPYEGNEHLLGKTGDCDEYYKTW